MLLPPGVSNPDVTKRSFIVDLQRAAGHCPLPLRAKRNRIGVKLDIAFLSERPPGWLTDWAAGLEAQGCLKAGDGRQLAARIAEALPLEAHAPFRLLFRDNIQTGQVDLGPNMRLEVVSPAESVPPDAPILDIQGKGNSLNVTVQSSVRLSGYETAWYALEPRSTGPGFSIVPMSAERHIDRRTELVSGPSINYMHFSSSAAFYRLFYKSGQTDYTALVVAGSTVGDLDERTATLEKDSTLCATVQHEFCVEIPRRVGINPMIAVTVNGVEVRVGLGGTVGGAIRVAGGSPEGTLPTLTVERPYNDNPTPVAFDHANSAILRLPIVGGEVISWNQKR